VTQVTALSFLYLRECSHFIALKPSLHDLGSRLRDREKTVPQKPRAREPILLLGRKKLKTIKPSRDGVMPQLCPVCGSSKVDRIGRDVLLAAFAAGVKCPSTGAVAYHCHRGHVFLLLGKEFRWEEMVLIDSGEAICV
jgi:hypothetical protein